MLLPSTCTLKTTKPESHLFTMRAVAANSSATILSQQKQQMLCYVPLINLIQVCVLGGSQVSASCKVITGFPGFSHGVTTNLQCFSLSQIKFQNIKFLDQKYQFIYITVIYWSASSYMHSFTALCFNILFLIICKCSSMIVSMLLFNLYLCMFDCMGRWWCCQKVGGTTVHIIEQFLGHWRIAIPNVQFSD